MTEECDLLKTCGFFKKFGQVKNLACRGFIRQFCRGPKINECKRKQFRAEHGFPPHDDMMPSGHDIVLTVFDEDCRAEQTPDSPLPGPFGCV